MQHLKNSWIKVFASGDSYSLQQCNFETPMWIFKLFCNISIATSICGAAPQLKLKPPCKIQFCQNWSFYTIRWKAVQSPNIESWPFPPCFCAENIVLLRLKLAFLWHVWNVDRSDFRNCKQVTKIYYILSGKWNFYSELIKLQGKLNFIDFVKQ